MREKLNIEKWSIKSTKISIWDLASKLVEENFLKIENVIKFYETTLVTQEKYLLNDFFKSFLLLNRSVKEKYQDDFLEWNLFWDDLDFFNEYFFWNKNKSFEILYYKVWKNWKDSLNNLIEDWYERKFFNEMILKYIFHIWNHYSIFKKNLENMIMYLYPDMDSYEIKELIINNTNDNKKLYKNKLWDDELFQKIFEYKIELNKVLETSKWGTHLDYIKFLEKCKVAWWEKYQLYK